MSNTPPTPRTPAPQEHPLLPLASALALAGYKPQSLLWDATLRLAQAPEVCAILLQYVGAKCPKIDYKARTPEMLFRKLPGGYTVAGLVRDYEFELAGAITIAGQLYYDPGRAKATLAQLIAEGYWKTLPDGKRVRVIPAAAKGLVACPQCGLRRKEIKSDCPKCGYGKARRAIDEKAAFVDFMEPLLNRPAKPEKPARVETPEQAEKECPHCRAQMPETANFCGKCGKDFRVPPARFCAKCGKPHEVGMRFCPGCGSPL